MNTLMPPTNHREGVRGVYHNSQEEKEAVRRFEERMHEEWLAEKENRCPGEPSEAAVDSSHRPVSGNSKAGAMSYRPSRKESR